MGAMKGPLGPTCEALVQQTPPGVCPVEAKWPKLILFPRLPPSCLVLKTYDYARHFLSACSRVLEGEASPKGVEYDGHYCAIGVYPIGVDPDHISVVCRTPAVHALSLSNSIVACARDKTLLALDMRRACFCAGWVWVVAHSQPRCLLGVRAPRPPGVLR